MLIAQISDTHVVAAGGSLQRGQVDPNTLLERAVERLNALRPRPDLVLVTGDLTNHGSHEAYVELKALLARLEALPKPAILTADSLGGGRGADTVVDFGGGDQFVLAGVQVSSLTGPGFSTRSAGPPTGPQVANSWRDS